MACEHQVSHYLFMSEHLPQCLLLLGLSEESRNYGGPGPLTTGQTSLQGSSTCLPSLARHNFIKLKNPNLTRGKRSRQTESVCEEFHPSLLKVALS